MKPTFDNLLKYIPVLLCLPVSWAYFQPERSWPWLFRACQLLLLATYLVQIVYRYRTKKGLGLGGTALGDPAEK